MLKRSVLIVTVFHSIVTFNSVCAKQKCHITDGFDIDKMVGTWHYVAGINPKKARIRCEELMLKKVGKYNLYGHKVGFSRGALRNLTITAYVRNNIMDLRIYKNDQMTKTRTVIFMWMRTCNGNTEFALESPRRKMYWIYSRNTTATSVFMKNYRMMGEEMGLKLRRANRSFCPAL